MFNIKNKYLKEVVDILVAFLIAWLCYQVIGFAFGTSIPITSIVSESMKHETDFNDWWLSNEKFYLEYDISKEDFEKYQFKNGLNVGDMMIIVFVPTEKIKQGDVIVYRKTKPSCFRAVSVGSNIIHRVVSVENGVFTKGDNGKTNKNLDLDENGSSCVDEIQGRAVLVLPLLGYPRMILHMLGI